MAIEIVEFPIKNGGSFHSYVKLPEGMPKWWSSLRERMMINHDKHPRVNMFVYDCFFCYIIP